MKDRRTARRYDLSLPIMFGTPNGITADSWTGKTRDISARGVYFIIDNDLGMCAELDLTMSFPAEVTGDSEVFIKTAGKVVRVDKRSGSVEQKVGVAAVFERYEIVRNK